MSVNEQYETLNTVDAYIFVTVSQYMYVSKREKGVCIRPQLERTESNTPCKGSKRTSSANDRASPLPNPQNTPQLKVLHTRSSTFECFMSHCSGFKELFLKLLLCCLLNYTYVYCM